MFRSLRNLSLELILLISLLYCCQPGDEVPTLQTAEDVASSDEATRRRLLRAELTYLDRYDATFDASELSERDQTLLRHLMRVGELIEELNMLQVHPQNLEWYAQVLSNGSEDERELYRRYQMPWCFRDDHPLCVALVGIPERQMGAVHWPEGMTDAEFEAICAARNRRELLSPFTVVRRSGENQWQAIPFSQTEIFGPRMRQVATALRAAAEHADTESLATYLRSRADAFEAESPFPWDRTDYDWIRLDSRWDVTVGPYEVYSNPRQIKARFAMYVGILEPEVTEFTSVFRDNLQEMENLVAQLVGADIYSARTIQNERISIRAIRLAFASGDGRRLEGATVAFHLPNRGPSVDEGLYKKVILVTHADAFHPIYRARAQLALDEDQAAMMTSLESVLGTMFHEFAHGLGAYDELEITTDGEQTTVGEALGDAYTTLFEELKADIVGLWLMEKRRQAGAFDDEQATRWYVCHVMHIFGLMEYSLRGVYPRMCAIQLGHFRESGAITYNEETGHFRVILERMPQATEELARQVVRIQLSGDRAAAQALHDRWIQRNAEGEYMLAPSIAGPAAAISERFANAGIRSVTMRYQVNGL